MNFNPNNLKNLRPTTGEGRKLYIETYGCQMNAGDSEVVVSILQSEGFVYTEEIALAVGHQSGPGIAPVAACHIGDTSERV